jgi:hypothetical protein
MKWGALALLLAFAGIRCVRPHPVIYHLPVDHILGAALIWAAFLLLLGVVGGHWLGYSWIEHGTGVFAATFLLTGLHLPAIWLRRAGARFR